MRHFSKTMKTAYPGEDLDLYREAGTLPDDLVEIDDNAWAALLAAERAGKIIDADASGHPVAIDPPPPTPSQIESAKIKAAESAVQKMLDAAALKKGYDDIKSASGYASLPAGEPFQAEGAAYLLWRAQCWAKCYEVLDEVKAGTRAEPTIPELLAEMPALVLP